MGNLQHLDSSGNRYNPAGSCPTITKLYRNRSSIRTYLPYELVKYLCDYTQLKLLDFCEPSADTTSSSWLSSSCRIFLVNTREVTFPMVLSWWSCVWLPVTVVLLLLRGDKSFPMGILRTGRPDGLKTSIVRRKYPCKNKTNLFIKWDAWTSIDHLKSWGKQMKEIYDLQAHIIPTFTSRKVQLLEVAW